MELIRNTIKTENKYFSGTLRTLVENDVVVPQNKPDIGKILGKVFNSLTVNFIICPAFILIASDVYYKANFEGSPLKSAIGTIREHFVAFLLFNF